MWTVVGPFLDDRLRFRRRLLAGLKAFQQGPECNADRIAAIGYCIGGCGVLELARAAVPLRGVVSLFTATRSTVLRAKELSATEHPKLDCIHKRKPDRRKRRSSSCEKYLNKGSSYSAVTRIGRLAVGQTMLLPEATVGLAPTNAQVVIDGRLPGSYHRTLFF